MGLVTGGGVGNAILQQAIDDWFYPLPSNKKPPDFSEGLVGVYEVNLGCLELEADVNAHVGEVTEVTGTNGPWAVGSSSDYKPELISRPHNNTCAIFSSIAICV